MYKMYLEIKWKVIRVLILKYQLMFKQLKRLYQNVKIPKIQFAIPRSKPVNDIVIMVCHGTGKKTITKHDTIIHVIFCYSSLYRTCASSIHRMWCLKTLHPWAFNLTILKLSWFDLVLEIWNNIMICIKTIQS